MPGLRSLIDGMDLWQFRDMVSPVFFSLFPPRVLLREARRLFTNYRDPEGFANARRATGSTLQRAGVSVTVAQPPGCLLASSAPHAVALSPQLRKDRGQAVLQLYFAQLWMAPTPALLDLSLHAFKSDSSGTAMQWDPQPLYAEWRPEFRTAIHDLYRGFYRDDQIAFARGTRVLGMTSARQALLEHFSQRNQVAFSVRQFHDAFHEVFTCCAQGERNPLPPEFLTFGVCLATLHQHLEQLGVELDVRQAYERIEQLRLQ